MNCAFSMKEIVNIVWKSLSTGMGFNDINNGKLVWWMVLKLETALGVVGFLPGTKGRTVTLWTWVVRMPLNE